MAEASVRISLTAGEVEIQGSEDFIARYDDVLDELIGKFKEVPVAKVVAQAKTKANNNGSSDGGDGDGDDDHEPLQFGEALHAMPKGASGTDQILLAGWYAQRENPDSAFATVDASKMLIEQGIKLANPTQSLNNNQSSKRVFKVGKKWRIAKPGEDHLKSLGATL